MFGANFSSTRSELVTFSLSPCKATLPRDSHSKITLPFLHWLRSQGLHTSCVQRISTVTRTLPRAEMYWWILARAVVTGCWAHLRPCSRMSCVQTFSAVGPAVSQLLDPVGSQPVTSRLTTCRALALASEGQRDTRKRNPNPRLGFRTARLGLSGKAEGLGSGVQEEAPVFALVLRAASGFFSVFITLKSRVERHISL